MAGSAGAESDDSAVGSSAAAARRRKQLLSSCAFSCLGRTGSVHRIRESSKTDGRRRSNRTRSPMPLTAHSASVMLSFCRYSKFSDGPARSPRQGRTLAKAPRRRSTASVGGRSHADGHQDIGNVDAELRDIPGRFVVREERGVLLIEGGEVGRVRQQYSHFDDVLSGSSLPREGCARSTMLPFRVLVDACSTPYRWTHQA
jgi:hypothetical protein